nr:hypothetical protein [uncultured Roseibium sp.]
MSSKRRTAVQRSNDKQSAMQAKLFPEQDGKKYWDVKDKARTKGYTSMPRTIPLIGAMADLMAGKGKPVTSTYLELWCRCNERGFVNVSKHSDVSFASGFSGERGISTWKQRLRKLEALGFISIQSGTAGEIHYVQIWNPYLVIKFHEEAGTDGFSDKHYNAYLDRYYEIGALDLEETPVAAPAQAMIMPQFVPAPAPVPTLAQPAAIAATPPQAAVTPPAPTTPAPAMPEVKKTDT